MLEAEKSRRKEQMRSKCVPGDALHLVVSQEKWLNISMFICRPAR
jgi:hypothetical protein